MPRCGPVYGKGKSIATQHFTIVGAGLSGATFARILAEAGHFCSVIEKRDHIAGNTYDETTETGHKIHRYGPHIFHTNSEKVWSFLSRFTEWTPYHHRVLALSQGEYFPMPVNATTLEQLAGYAIPYPEAWLAGQQTPFKQIHNAEQAALSRVGRLAYERLYRGYTEKMWGRPASELSAQVTNRLPVRLDRTEDYFDDRYQAIPTDGYTAMVSRMLDHPNIGIHLGTKQDSPLWNNQTGDITIWTGPLDDLFDQEFGPLPYRSLTFTTALVPLGDQSHILLAPTVNFADAAIPFTRVTEISQITGVCVQGAFSGVSLLIYEQPTEGGDPYYPIPGPESDEIARKYRERADTLRNVITAGRLGSYRYYNMDQVVAEAMTKAERILA